MPAPPNNSLVGLPALEPPPGRGEAGARPVHGNEDSCHFQGQAKDWG